MIKKRFRKSKLQKKRKINGCKVVKVSEKTEDFPFCSDVIYMNKNNQIGFELNYGRIRIDGLLTNCEENFFKMIDALVEIARLDGYPLIMFADPKTSEEILLFKKYGFKGNMNFRECYLEFKV